MKMLLEVHTFNADALRERVACHATRAATDRNMVICMAFCVQTAHITAGIYTF